MRLTLRTLLAYMDGELERKFPQEAQEIGKKIADSPFATELFHKVRDVMRRLRLAAPSITERGANVDCNTVAEYLDNELPDDRVPDFEEVCLKSDMHLAEVASCHQILAIVQVEAAEIGAESRQRMYQLPSVAGRGDEERLAAAEAATAISNDGKAPSPAAAPVKVRPRPVVPDYLREPAKKRRLLPAAAITFLACAIIGLVLAFTGQFNHGTPIGNLIERVQTMLTGKTVAKSGSNDGDQPGNRATGGGAKTSAESTTANSSGAGARPIGSAESGATGGTPAAGPGRDSGAPPAASATQPIEPPVAMPDLVPPQPGADNVTAGQPGLSSTNAVPATITPPPGVGPIPAKDTGMAGPAISATATGRPLPIVPADPPKPEILAAPPDGTAIPSVAGPHVLTPPPEDSGNNPRGTPSPKSGEVARIEGKNPPRAGNQSRVARFTSDGQDVLLKFDAPGTDWHRVLPEEFLTVNQRLLALPSYRSRIDIFDGATIELFNGTRIELLQSAPTTPLGIGIDFGRMVVKQPQAQSGARLRIVAGAHTGILTLGSVESVAAVEVTRIHDPGTDPEKVLSHALTKLYVARGGATWEEGDKPPAQLTAPAVYSLDGTKADAASSTDVPKWITSNTIDEYEQRAAVSVLAGPARGALRVGRAE